MDFIGILEKYKNNLWNYHIKVPEEVIEHLKNKKMKRFLCSLNGGEKFHASLMPAGEGIYFIKINKELRKSHAIKLQDDIRVKIEKDPSKYGVELPSEFEELMFHDPVGCEFFENLTPGKQRSLLYLVGKVKSSIKRSEKSFIILEHLKEQKGQLDFKILNEDFKNKRGHL